ncbi:hypothetical protein [Sphingobium sp.]|uniref:hypothetical protein n=1 Tax=Sphingobium sp. TaxID=1912891 RepID=UPI0028BEA8AE|nr:hypothetical protein [Sphingobium sp.]
MTDLPPPIGARVSDPQRNPTPVPGRRAIRGSGLLRRRISWSQYASRGISISAQCGLQILGIDLVVFNGGADLDTHGGRCPSKGRTELAFYRLFIRFDHIGSSGQKRFETR